MHQEKLFYESLEDAIRDTVTALGGPKLVGHALKPEKSPAAAGRWLNDCLNDARPEVLHFDQFLWIAQMARREGVHNIAMQFMRECDYQDPVPTDPEDKAAELKREFVRSVDRLQKLAEEITATEARVRAVS